MRDADLKTWLRGRMALDAAFLKSLDQRPAALVPAYFSPTSSLWDTLLSAASDLDIVAVANPASGPGSTRNQSYTDLLAKAVKAGASVVGYVPTGYGTRSSSAVLADIANWYGFYPAIAGIFFDQQATDQTRIPVYASYFAEVHRRGGVAISNPGATCDEGYYTTAKADCLVLWERAAAAGTPTLPSWAVAAADLVIAGLVHSADDATLTRLVPAMRSTGFGRVFVTRDTLPNPWDTLGDFEAYVAASRG